MGSDDVVNEEPVLIGNQVCSEILIKFHFMAAATHRITTWCHRDQQTTDCICDTVDVFLYLHSMICMSSNPQWSHYKSDWCTSCSLFTISSLVSYFDFDSMNSILWCFLCLGRVINLYSTLCGSMYGILYIPTFTIKVNYINVGKYTIHTWIP